MKIRRMFSLLFLLILCFSILQPMTTLGAQSHEFILHKRLFPEENVPDEINQAGELGDPAVLQHSYGVNGSAFAIFEVSQYADHLVRTQQLSAEEVQAYLRDEAKVLRNDLAVLTAADHPSYAALQNTYPGIKWVDTLETATQSFVNEKNDPVSEQGILSAKLPVGENQQYLFVELSGSEQLEMNQDRLAAYVLIDSTFASGEQTHIYTKNFVYARELYFRKMGKETDGKTHPLPGAQFVLSRQINGEKQYLMETTGISSEWLSEKETTQPLLADSRVKKMTSDQEGIVRTTVGLKSGSYLFEEVATVDGYEISEAAKNITVVIPEDRQAAILVNGEALPALTNKEQLPVVYNEQAVGKKIFQKIDNDSKNPLEGAEFVVCNADNHYLTKQGDWVESEYGNQHYEEVLVLRSDQKGRFEIEGLAYGSYALLEVRAPDGYFLPSNHFIEFEVNQASQQLTEPLLIVNQKEDKPELPSTGGSTDKPAQKLTSNRLPQTGETISARSIIIGIICVLTAFILKKKRSIKYEN
ncbi:hypothetical protein NRIC_32400 [Enterococcus florum]|uniref:Cell wall surface anchor protein n=1 Tax=Enterococcus florum TaxID=2480627 RepID=A0A4V0WPX2_9ENTE|nr:SpaA isopeptide-forming pilin-related protein [Enterococcus florum]GCF95349.1 hypothetical protein NRIC_32400 [Enterococcus florum]